MKTILMTVLLACGLMTGACSRKAPITAAQAAPEPKTIAVQAAPTPPQMSESEIEAERQRQLAARAEADKLLAVPTPAPESAPIITANDPEPSGLVPSTNLERKEPLMTGPTSGIAVEVVSISGKIIAAELKTNGRGAINVQLPGPGTYLVRYSSGPSKGKVARTINATDAGGVNISVPPPTAAP